MARGGKGVASLGPGPTTILDKIHYSHALNQEKAKHPVPVPDPITFVVSPEYLNRPNLYPRQATLIKIVFLRWELLTEYDLMVIAEWEAMFVASNGKEGLNGGKDGLVKRMKFLRFKGHKWFREVLLVMGRRAGKGHVTALCMAYVMWNYMASPQGDPQEHFGVDRDKQLVALIFAGKRDQAKATVFGDLANIIADAPCFAPWIYPGGLLAESVSVMAPHDVVRMRDQKERGIVNNRNQATFLIQPRESTMMAGRGPTSFMQCLDPLTPVLTTDLQWVPIKDIQVGDELIGIDEYPSDGKQRAMRRSKVQAVWSTRKAAVRLTFDDGSTVVCSPDHQWLGADRGKSGNYRWYKAAAMKPGYQIRRLVDPWDEDASQGAGYLAGFFDGEGCIVTTGNRNVNDVLWSQNPGPVLAQVNQLLEERGFTPRLNRDADFKRCQAWALRGDADTLRFLGQIRPVRLFSKSSFVWEGRRPSNARMGYPITKTIVSIEELPEQELIDITTSTRTFVANGLFTHNCFDEAAHIVATGANRSAQEVYDASKPSLDQFKKDAFLMHPSSPWQMLGMFYDNWLRANELDEDGYHVYYDMLSVQLASWDIYKGWELTQPDLSDSENPYHGLSLFPDMVPWGEDYTPHPLQILKPMVPFIGDRDTKDYAQPKTRYSINPSHWIRVEEGLPRFKPLKGAIQDYDEQMMREERANPDTFKVERKAQWAAALDAYLNEEKVAQIFQPWEGRPERFGPPTLTRQSHGPLIVTYKGHADPSKVNDKFGICVAHAEYDNEGRAHCVIDLLHHFDPADFPDHIIDYEYVDNWIWDNIITKFHPEEFTFDQYNSTSSIQKLQKNIRNANPAMPKRIQVFEKTVTRANDWEIKENTKAAINLGRVHCYSTDDIHAYRAEQELKFLQLVNGRVDHPEAGPVQSKDIADCICECVNTLIGEEVNNFMHKELSEFQPAFGLQGGTDPFPNSRQGGAGTEAEERMSAMSAFGSSRGRPEYTPSRNLNSRRYRR